jgi:hypothetical protein
MSMTVAWPGGKFVTDVPGESPSFSPNKVGVLVFVTVDPARTLYSDAVANGTVGTMAAFAVPPPVRRTATAVTVNAVKAAPTRARAP